MTPTEVTAIVGASIVAAAGAVGAALRIFRPSKDPPLACPVDAGTALRELHETSREQVTLLREMRDLLIAQRQDLRMQAMEQGHLQKSVDALHSRYDKLIEAARHRGIE